MWPACHYGRFSLLVRLCFSPPSSLVCRNKNTNIEHRASADKAPLKVAGGKAKQKRDKNAAKDEESD